MSKLDKIAAPIQVDGTTYLIFDKQQIKELFLELIGENPKGDHEIAEGVRQYQEELRQRVEKL